MSQILFIYFFNCKAFPASERKKKQNFFLSHFSAQPQFIQNSARAVHVSRFKKSAKTIPEVTEVKQATHLLMEDAASV